MQSFDVESFTVKCRLFILDNLLLHLGFNIKQWVTNGKLNKTNMNKHFREFFCQTLFVQYFVFPYQR